MKKIFSMLLFICFLLLSVWEVVPKFIEIAIEENVAALAVAKTKKKGAQKKEKGAEEKKEDIDYRKMIENIDVNG